MSQPVYSQQYRHSWALVVGIDQYRDPRLPPLATAVKGARAVAQLLQDDLGFDPERIIHLENEEATQRAIRRAFTDPLCRADLVGPDDRVLVYFGGHGLTYDTAEGEFGCIAPYDIEAQYFDTAIPMDELTRAANRMHAKHVLFLLDACFSGYATVREVDPGVQRQAEDFLTRPVRQVITAGTRDQAVSDLWGPEQHALFTGFLLEGLRGAAPAPGGVLRAFHLAGYLQDAVAQHSRSRQTPQYASLMGSRGGDFIFSVRDVVKLPDWIVAAVESDDAGQRMVAASRLLDIVQGDDPRLADAALAHLERLAGDENPLVRSSAAAALEQVAPPPAPPSPETVRHELPVVEPMPEAQPPPRVSEPAPTPVTGPTPIAGPTPTLEPPARKRATPRRGLPGWVWVIGGLAAAALLVGVLALAGVFAPKAAPAPAREEEAAPAMVTVPDVVGMEYGEAISVLEEAGFDVELVEVKVEYVVGQPSAAEGEQYVTSQSPDAGVQIAAGSTVKIAQSPYCYVTPTPSPATQLFTLEGQHSDRVWGVAWSPDGSLLASGSWDNTVVLWDAQTGEPLYTLESPGGVYSLAFSPDGSALAAALDDHTVIVWDTVTRDRLHVLEGHTNEVDAVAWSPDGSMLASGSYDSTVIVWDADTGEQIRTLVGHTFEVHGVAWSPDGAKLVSGAGLATGEDDPSDRVIVWDVGTGEPLYRLDRGPLYVIAVAWSPDGLWLASGGADKVVTLWDAGTGERLLDMEGHTAQVTCLAWSPDGSLLASGSDDGTIILWDAETGSRLQTLDAQADWVRNLAWSPDGTRLASANTGFEQGMVVVWQVTH